MEPSIPSKGRNHRRRSSAHPGNFTTIQSGVNALSLNTTIPQVLFIYPGTYIEQVYIPLLRSNLTVQGWTTDARSYEHNTATITFNLSKLSVASNDLTATVRQWNTNTKFYNLNIANTFGHVDVNGQNLAVSAHTGNQGYYGVQFWGYQDTILANTGNQLYAKSLIVGAIDFIFGQTATAWFEKVDIRTIATGYITASGRSAATNPSWYVISHSTVDGINDTVPAGSSSLGRPWSSFARVVFQNTYLGNVIQPAGWSVWSSGVAGNTLNVTFGEYANYGPGSIAEEGPRANFSSQLDVPISRETVLGDGYENEWWVDMRYL
ncbi:Pectinesterase [Lachnellula hyalina]|uniref:Pectinesterase n=1 Tax=Lachnellula hyalina TaxID=1316788 RepID=A0A8H8TVG3_9HELO|nr:Pectinesterase [Lachnellula hyalina]TVY23337.1 Pectinesterase [Lachnellula hyalina]